MLIGLHKIPQISFMAAFATLLLSILDPGTHSNQMPRVRARARGRARVRNRVRVTELVEPVLVL